MNKKFSTLVASLLLGTAFGASAQNFIDSDDAKFESGKYYMLGTGFGAAAAADVLAVSGDALSLVGSGAIRTVADREFALWKVDIAFNAVNGSYTYQFTNKKTGQQLSVPVSGKALASSGAINSFAWGAATNGPATTPDFAHGTVASVVGAELGSFTAGEGKKYVMQQVYVAKEDITVAGANSSAAAFSTITTKLERQINVMTYVATGGTGVVTDYKDAVAVSSVIAGTIGDVKVTAPIVFVGATTTAVGAATDGQNTVYPAGTVFIAGGNTVTPLKFAPTTVSDVDLMGKGAFADEVGATSSSFAFTAATDDANVLKDKKFEVAYVKMLVDPTIGRGMGLTATNSAIGTYNTSTAASGAFNGAITTFKAASPATDQTITALKIAFATYKGLAEAAGMQYDANFMAVEALVKNVKVGDDVSAFASAEYTALIASVAAKNTATPTDGVKLDATKATHYFDVPVLKVAGEDNYLVVDTTVWTTSNKASHYHMLAVRPLKDLTSSVAGLPANNTTKYYNAENQRMGANYLFDMNYVIGNDSVVIKPMFTASLYNASESWATDTLGVTSAATNKVTVAANTDMQLSLFDFSGKTQLTLVNTAVVNGKPTEQPKRISLGKSTSEGLVVADIASGVYHIQLVSTDQKNDKYKDNGKYRVDALLTPDQKWASLEAQDFTHMPATQWIVEKDANSKSVTINNRETNAAYLGAQPLYVNGENVFAWGGDTLKLTKLTADAIVADSTLGYYAWDKKKDVEKVFALNYFSGLDLTKCVAMNAASGKDSTLMVDPKEGKAYFGILSNNDLAAYGAETAKAANKRIAKALYKESYRLYVVPATNYIAATDTLYIVKDAAGLYRLKQTSYTNAAKFYLKEFNNNKAEGAEKATCYYAMLDKDNAGTKVGVKDGVLSLRNEALSEVRTSAFALLDKEAPLYRRLGVTDKDDKFVDLKVDTAKIYVVSNPNRFLNENSVNKIAGSGKEEGLNYLGEFNISQFPKSTAAIFIDTAYVRNETKRPQYLLGLRPTFNHAVPCPDDETHPVTGEESVEADYLVNLTDSLATQPKAKYETYTRLAFVPAKHIGDNFVVKNSTGYKAGKAAAADTISFAKNEFNKAAFQFRLVKEGSADFMIESRKGEYVKIHNGVPVLTTNIADAETFNLSKTADVATDNEAIGTTEVSVIAGEGQVVINNAAGKTVVISNILGQTIAQTVLTSDNATISVPAGIVVVAVEGEAAVKAIIK